MCLLRTETADMLLLCFSCCRYWEHPSRNILCVFKQIHKNILLVPLSVQTVLTLSPFCDNVLEIVLYLYTVHQKHHRNPLYDRASGLSPVFRCFKNDATDELAHGPFTHVRVQAVTGLQSLHSLSVYESSSVQHLYAVWKASFQPSA